MSGKVIFSAVGDIGLHGRAGEEIVARGPGWAFAPAAGILGRADILFGNLEIPFSGPEARPARRDISSGFRSEPETAAALRSGGFDVVSLANNHIMDYGAEGLETTIAILEREGILHVGAGMDEAEARRPVVVERNGRRFGITACAMKGTHTAGGGRPGAAPLDDLVLDGIRSLGERTDTVVVSVHFGKIFTDFPTREDQAAARRMIDAGADAVIGHHSHVVQGIERYGKGIIAYSLGEFIFDPAAGFVEAAQMAGLRRRSMLLEIGFGDTKVEADPVPVVAGEDLRPVPVEGRAREEFLDRLDSISRVLPRYDIDFEGHLAERIVPHETKVALYNLRRGNIMYVLRKLPRMRPGHAVAIIRAGLGGIFRSKREGR